MPTTLQTHVPGIRKWSNAQLLDPSLACELSISFYSMFNASSLNLCTRKLTVTFSSKLCQGRSPKLKFRSQQSAPALGMLHEMFLC
jgi:hypothetical protein